MGFLGFFQKKDKENTALPKTDTERWITGTYAMWSEYADGDWHYFAGSKEKNKKEGASMRVMLRRDWEVTDKNSLLDMVLWLTSSYKEKDSCTDEEIAWGAWDLCRACQILGMGFIGGYIGREEMMEKSMEVGQLMQALYHSWTELYDSYLKGYREWRRKHGDGWQKDIAEREALCFRLRNDLNGPCSLPWELDLK